jgi:hypothetical protein
MNFLLLNQYKAPDPSPTARLLGDLAASLEEAGHQVTTIAQQRKYLGRPRGGIQRLLRELRAMAEMVIASLRLRRSPDVVLALSSPPCLLPVAAAIAWWHRARLAHWAMDLYPELAVLLGEIARGHVSRLITGLMRIGYTQTDLLIALDKDMASHLQRTYNVTARVLPPWPAHLRTEVRLNADESSPGAKLAAQQWTWLYSGNLGRAHEWKPLLDVQQQLEQRNLPIQLLFEGGGAAWPEAQRYGDALHLRSCRWTGYVTESQSFQTLRTSHLIVATQRRVAQGLLWPSKLARVIPLTKPLLWIGPTGGAIAQSLLRRPYAGVFEPEDVLRTADWIHELWAQRNTVPPQESDEDADALYRDKIAAGCAVLRGWLEEL